MTTIRAGQAKNVGSERTSPKTTVVKKVAENMNSPFLPDPLKTLSGLDQYLQDEDYPEVSNLPEWTSSFNCLTAQLEEVLEESKVDLEGSAYRRGFTRKQDIWKSLADVPLPAPYDFPAIEDESFYLNFETPLKVSSERKRQEIDLLTNFVEDLKFSKGIPAGGDDWFSCSNGSWL